MNNSKGFYNAENTPIAEFANTSNTKQLLQTQQQSTFSPRLPNVAYGENINPAYYRKDFADLQSNGSNFIQPSAQLNGSLSANSLNASHSKSLVMNPEMFNSMMQFFNSQTLAFQGKINQSRDGPLQPLSPNSGYHNYSSIQDYASNRSGSNPASYFEATLDQKANNLSNFYTAYGLQNVSNLGISNRDQEKVGPNLNNQANMLTSVSNSFKSMENRSKTSPQIKYDDLGDTSSFPTQSQLMQKELQSNPSNHSQFLAQNRQPGLGMISVNNYSAEMRAAELHLRYQRQDNNQISRNESSKSEIEKSSLSNNANKRDSRQYTNSDENEENPFKNFPAPKKKEQTLTKQSSIVNDHDERPITASGQYNSKNFKDQKLVSFKFAHEQPSEHEQDGASSRRVNHFESNDLYQRKNSFDEMPINGKPTKKFEDLLNEQIRKDPTAVPQRRQAKHGNSNKTFLKRGSRQFLSSAAARIKKNDHSPKSQHSASNDSSPRNTRYQSRKNHLPSAKNRSQISKERSPKNRFKDEDDTIAVPIDRKPHKFLARGEGVGGGKGNIGQSQQIDSLNAKKTAQDWRSSNEEDYGIERKTSQKSLNKKITRTQASENGRGNKNKFKTEEVQDNNDSFDRAYDHEKYLRGNGFSSGKKSSFNNDFGNFRSLEAGHYRSDQGFSDAYDKNPFSNEFKEAESEDDSTNPSQQSGFAQKYFTVSKDKAVGSDNSKKQEKQNLSSQTRHNEGDLQKIVNEKIEALNAEIAKFKLENQRVKKIRQKHEETLADLNSQIEEFQKSKEKEENEFNAWKDEEIKKLRQEKRAIHKNAQAAGNAANRKDHDEIEELRDQLAKCQEEMKNRDHKNKTVIEKQKKQIEEITAKCTEHQKRKQNGQAETQKPNNLQMIASKITEMKSNKTGSKNQLPQQDVKQQKTLSKKTGSHSKLNTQNEIIDEEDWMNDEDEDSEQNCDNYDPIKSRDRDHESRKNLGSAKKKETNASGLDADMKDATPAWSPEKGGLSNRERGNQQSKVILLSKQFGENDHKYSSNFHFKRTLNQTSTVINQTVSNDGKIHKVYDNGKKEILFTNGVRRETYPDGYIIIYFSNSDIKQTFPDGTMVYYFAEAETTQTSLASGVQIYRFANNQIEIHNIDGTKEIYFADGTKKLVLTTQEEFTVFTDGTTQKLALDKIKHVDYPNGQKDLIYPDGSRVRTFPDGKVQKLPAGSDG